jgi:hypothetical protein
VPTDPHQRTINRAVIAWGHMWPAAPKPNVHPAPRPVITMRATSYVLQASTDGHFWDTVATVHEVHGRGTDVLRFPAVRAEFVRLRMTKGIRTFVVAKEKEKLAPMLQELTVS